MSDPVATTLSHATAIIVAYLAWHEVPPAELPNLVFEVRAAVDWEVASPRPLEPARKLRPLRSTSDPAVRRSPKPTMPDYIVLLETGQWLKVREKHLLYFSLTPAAYRALRELPADQPMVAPRFGAWRSDHGRMLDLGGEPRLSTGA